jgi:hypothetical protein
LISSKEIIAKIYRDLKPANSNFQQDAIEWFAEALSFIGANSGLERVQAISPISGYKALLPDIKTNILAVLYSSVEKEDNEPDTILRILRDKPKVVKRSSGLRDNIYNHGACEVNYSINNTYLHISEEKGTAMILYTRPILDSDGYPMIPDHGSFRQALTFYTLLRMMDGGYQHPHLRYQEVEQRWLKYCTQARNAKAFPDLEMLERIRQQRTELDNTLPDHLLEREVHRGSNTYPYGATAPPDISVLTIDYVTENDTTITLAVPLELIYSQTDSEIVLLVDTDWPSTEDTQSLEVTYP